MPKELVAGKDKLSRRELNLLRRTFEYARNSSCVNRHAALVYKGGRVLSIAVNKYHNDSSLFEYYSKDKRLRSETKRYVGEHAEVVATKNIEADVLVGATIFVARMRTNGCPGFSRPCPDCERHLIACGVRKVCYTSDDMMEEFELDLAA